MPDSPLEIYRRELAKLLKSVEAGEAELASVHAKLSEDVIAKLRTLPDNANMPAAQLQALFDAEFAKTLPRRARIIRGNIEAGAKAGPRAARKTFRAVLGDDVTQAHVRSNAKALREASERIAGRVTVDGVGLTKRMRRVDREVAQEMAAEVQSGIRQRKGILNAARKIEKLDKRAVELPQYLQELESAARLGKADDVKLLAKRYAARIAKLGEAQVDGTFLASKYSLKAATKKFVQDVQTASGKGLDKVVQRYVNDKLSFRNNLIARHESVEAFRSTYIEQTKKKPGCWGYRWTLSTRHATHEHGGSKQDVCDIYANQDIGLGKGVYTAETLPKTPHPCCLCYQVAIVRRDVFDIPASEQNQPPASARTDKPGGAAGWLKENPGRAAAILGPTRNQLFQQGHSVLDASGKPQLVRNLLGSRAAAE